MTPDRLIQLVTSALSRKPTPLDVDAWRSALQHTRDDDADQALAQHRANSPHPPTPADVRRGAVAIANTRADRAATERRRLEIQTGICQEGDQAGKPLKPMPPEIRDGLKQLAHRYHVPDVDPDDQQRMAQARAEIAARKPIPEPAAARPVGSDAAREDAR